LGCTLGVHQLDRGERLQVRQNPACVAHHDDGRLISVDVLLGCMEYRLVIDASDGLRVDPQIAKGQVTHLQTDDLVRQIAHCL
jgi:hypothetical protein